MVPVRHDHSIEVFFPPVVASCAEVSQNDLPFAIDFTDELYDLAVRQKVLVARLIDETPDITLYRLPGPERCV